MLRWSAWVCLTYFLVVFWAVLSRHEQVPRMQRWKGQSSPHTVVNWKGSGGISAADLAGKYSLRAAILSLDSVPGLGASSLGWGAAKSWHSCPARARCEMDAFCAPEEENTVAVTVGGHTSQCTGREAVSGVSPLHRQQGRQPGQLRSTFSCTESVKQSKTQGKSFSRSPAGFALTLPHLVWGRQESGYYEHFLFIKPELQELICLLGKVAEHKAVPCPARTLRLVQRIRHCSASSTSAWQRPCLDWCAEQHPDFPGPLWELLLGTQLHFTFAPSPEPCWCQGRCQWSTERFSCQSCCSFQCGSPGMTLPKEQSSPHCCPKGWHRPRGSVKSHFCWGRNSQADPAFQTQMATTLRLKSLAAPQRKSKGKFTKGPYVSESF